MTKLNIFQEQSIFNQNFRTFLSLVVRKNGYLHNIIRKSVQQFASDFLQNNKDFLSMDISKLIDAELLEKEGEVTDFWRQKLSEDPYYLVKAITGYSNEPIRVPEALVLFDVEQNNEWKQTEICYRLFSEKSGVKWINMADGEEKETGSLKALAEGFNYGLSFNNEPINVKRLLSLHNRCTTGVNGLRENIQSGEFRKEPVSFGFPTDNLENVYEIMTSKLYGNAYVITDNRLETLKEGEELEALVGNEIALYNLEMASLNEPFAKLLRIVEFIQMLVIVQPFNDGNNRTIGKVLLNLELLKHHLLPVQLEHNHFATAKKNDLIQMILQGMELFKAEPSDEERKLFCTPTITSMVSMLEQQPIRREQTYSPAKLISSFGTPIKEINPNNATRCMKESQGKGAVRRPREDENDKEEQSPAPMPRPFS